METSSARRGASASSSGISASAFSTRTGAGPVRDCANPLAVAFRELADEVGGEQDEIVSPLHQRGEPDRDDREAIVEVFAEASLLDRLLEIAVGGRDQAHVDGDRLAAPHPLDLALLHRAQDLRLQREAHVGDLVEEQGTAPGLLEATDLACDGARKRALFVTEQL